MVGVARENGIKESTYYSRVNRGWTKERAANDKPGGNIYDGEYSVYKNDAEIATGTAERCAEIMGVSVNYIKSLDRPAMRDRQAAYDNPEMATTAIRLDGMEDDE